MIVQAAAHTQYLGEIKLFFDATGNLLDWEGHPHYLGNEVVQGKVFRIVYLYLEVSRLTTVILLLTKLYKQIFHTGNLK